jgi:hypothetical protein
MKKIIFVSMMIAMLVLAVSASATTRYVDSVVGCGGNSPCYTDIQSAIDAATSGDTIQVAAGTYTVTSTITIPCDKLAINLIGAGRNVTFIEKSSGGTGAPVLQIGSSNCGAVTGPTVIDGFTFRNSGAVYPNTTANSAARGISIRASGSLDGSAWSVIRNCAFLNFTDTGVTPADYQFQYWEIAGNIFDGSRLAIWLNDSRHMKVQDNDIRNMVVGIGCDAGDDSFDISVKENVMDSGTSDGSSPSAYWPQPSNYYGIFLGGYAHDWTIVSNLITRNTWGIYVANRTAGNNLANVVMSENCIVDNRVLGSAASTAYGINNPTAVLLNAQNNWWGDASGPYHPTLNLGGLGDRVSDNVTFTPWLTAPAGICAPPPPPPAGPGSVYRAIVGNDALVGTAVVDPAGNPGAADPFYASAKYQQFMFDQIGLSVPVCFSKPGVPQDCEVFNAQTAKNQPEICDLAGKGSGSNGTSPPFTHRGLPNVKTPAGNSGWYEWWIRLPIKPSGEINIVIQCGVVKPNAFAVYDFDAIKLCAAETGERIGYGVCVRQEVDPGVSPVINTALPKIKAIAYPGPYNDFVPFNLTAFKNPSSYTLAFDAVTAAMSNNTNSQLLEGSSNTRILLKACMDKAIVTKLPVTGQINALGQTETDLEPGDLIYVRMDVPRQNSVDIYCHAQSARLMGIGEPPF